MWGTWSQLFATDRARNPLIEPRITLAIWRAGQVLSGRPGLLPFLLRRLYGVADCLWVRAYVGAELPPQVVVGPGLRLPHAGRGVVLHPSVRIGADVTLYHQVTVGVRDEQPAAVIGDRVEIGAGVKVLGPVHVGADARLGANAVVLTDVPVGATAAGVPATIRRRREAATG
jgi:serine O-acetyltransferase